MNKSTRSLISVTKRIVSYTLSIHLAFVVGCAEVTPDDTNNPWVPATAEIEQSLGVSNWYVETLDEGTTRIIGYDQSENQLSELKISTPLLDQVQTLIYELHVTQNTRIVMTESGVIENTLSAEPRGQEWFDAMVNVPSMVRSGSPVNKSIGRCIANEAGGEIVSLVCSWAGGHHGNVEDYGAVCSAIIRCLASDQYNDTYYASNNTGSSGYADSWSSNGNAGNTCYDSWGYATPCQNGGYQDNYQGYYQDSSQQNSGCYDQWGYPVSCDVW